MPSPSKPYAALKGKRICLFGDSHLGALKRALDAGMPEAEGVEIEYFGAPGPQFRDMYLREGRIVVADSARDVVEQVNQTGRTSLGAGDFDAYLFYSARLSIADFMRDQLERRLGPATHASAAVRKAALEHLIMSTRSARMALSFASESKAAVFVAPGPLLSDGVIPMAPSAAEGATAQDRDAVWGAFERFYGERGAVFLHQPEETIVKGYLTHKKYAVKGAKAARDAGHKNALFGQAVLRRFFHGLAEMQPLNAKTEATKRKSA